MAHLCLTLIVKELKISVEKGRVVTTLNFLFNVVTNELIEFKITGQKFKTSRKLPIILEKFMEYTSK